MWEYGKKTRGHIRGAQSGIWGRTRHLLRPTCELSGETRCSSKILQSKTCPIRPERGSGRGTGKAGEARNHWTIQHSEWASPVMTVLKADGSIRSISLIRSAPSWSSSAVSIKSPPVRWSTIRPVFSAAEDSQSRSPSGVDTSINFGHRSYPNRDLAGIQTSVGQILHRSYLTTTPNRTLAGVNSRLPFHDRTNLGHTAKRGVESWTILSRDSSVIHHEGLTVTLSRIRSEFARNPKNPACITVRISHGESWPGFHRIYQGFVM